MKNIKPTNPTLSATLFSDEHQQERFRQMPLSARMRPQSLDEYVGQKHILGAGKLLTRVIESDRLSSIILYGPPGVGKTTLAHCISQKTKTAFERINAVSSNVEELRRMIASSQNRWLSTNKKTVLFIDEIHRFNKAQQDVLMPDLEEGYLILIGATVFNPFFALTGPLISRSLVFELHSLSKDEILQVLQRALADAERGMGWMNIKTDANALEFLAQVSDGDARRALNALEIGCLTAPRRDEGIQLTLDVVQESIQKKQVLYDRQGDAHYDTASAFIKSMRGSDPDAALYWMAKMIYAGEDARFIARRICICAAEDVGNADPQASILANAALQISEFVGMPEARIVLAQAAVYVACAAKSNAVYLGIDKALDDVQHKRVKEVPVHLKDGSYPGAKILGHGQGYKYAHNFEGHYVEQEYVPEGVKYYEPTDIGFEKEIQQRQKQRKNKSVS
jgi:putative ATPase